jgi:hypothetical protein
MVRSPTFWFLVWLGFFALRTRSLTHSCYHHIEELIRANAYAGQRTIHAKERAELRPWRRSEGARGLYQPTAVTPVHPFRHVWLLPGPLFVLLPFRPFLRGVVIHWTPLVRSTPEWLDELAAGVAEFLGLHREDVDVTGVTRLRKLARIVRVSG